MKIKFTEARIDKHNGKYYKKDSIHEFGGKKIILLATYDSCSFDEVAEGLR